jgi:hypothetical protein
MSIMEARGGIPHVFRESVDNTTGRFHRFPFPCKHLIIRVTGNPCKLFFDELEFTKDGDSAASNHVLVPIPAAGTPHGEWQGPVEANGVWLRGSGGASAVELVAFQRRA